jgi:hypothetical protein
MQPLVCSPATLDYEISLSLMANNKYTEIQDKVGQPRTETGKAVIAE